MFRLRVIVRDVQMQDPFLTSKYCNIVRLDNSTAEPRSVTQSSCIFTLHIQPINRSSEIETATSRTPSRSHPLFRKHTDLNPSSRIYQPAAITICTQSPGLSSSRTNNGITRVRDDKPIRGASHQGAKIQAASSDMKRTHVDNKTAGAGFKKLMATGMASDKDAVQCKKKGPFQTLCLVWTLEKREEVEGTLVPCTRSQRTGQKSKW